MIGLTFLSINLVARGLISQAMASFVAQLIADALLVFGWASMWEPITVILYQLRPILRKKNVYHKISEMEIEILPLYHPALDKTVDFFED